MSGMFAGVASFNADISNWDVSRVTNVSGVFAGTQVRIRVRHTR